MPDEPTIGEVMRTLAGVQSSIDKLSSKVLTVDVWKAERESLDYRLRENEKDIAAVQAEAKKDIATVQAEAKAERDKRESEKAAADQRAANLRRQIIFTFLTAFIAPVFVAVVLAFMLKGS